MKKLFVVLIGLFFTAFAHADCSGTGLWVFPSGQSIKQNSIFVLDGYAESQNIVLNLNKKYNIYLEGGNKKIKLVVNEICVGQFYLTQAVLKPETQLEAGLEYTLRIDSLPKYESLNRYNSKTKINELVKYKVVAEYDTEKPILLKKTKEINKTLVRYGCGPAINVVFDCSIKDQSEFMVRTTLKNLKTGIETTYYIQAIGNKINVGHDMCLGAFDFDESNNYEAEFSFMDASGNMLAWKGERIKFTKPT